MRWSFLGVAIWWQRVRAAEQWTPTWDRSQLVRVVLVVPRSEAASAGRVLDQVRDFAQVGSNKATFFALDDWFAQEMRRYREGLDPADDAAWPDERSNAEIRRTNFDIAVSRPPANSRPNSEAGTPSWISIRASCSRPCAMRSSGLRQSSQYAW